MVQTWIAILSFASLTFLIALMALVLTCCRKRRKGVQHFYIIDEHGLRNHSLTDVAQNSLNNINVFQPTTPDKRIKKNTLIFASESLAFFKPKEGDGEFALLNETLDNSSFNNSILEVEMSTSNEFSTVRDDTKSCFNSSSTLRSFYSTFPPNSVGGDTFYSIELDSNSE